MKDKTLKLAIVIYLIIVLAGAIISVYTVGAEKDAEMKQQIEQLEDRVSDIAAAQVEVNGITPAMVQELTDENEALKKELKAKKDYIKGTDKIFNDKYDFEGHQKQYLETH